MKTRKNMPEPQAFVHFENGQNAKNACENEKNVQPDRMPLCISKMGKCQKRFESQKPTNAKKRS